MKEPSSSSPLSRRSSSSNKSQKLPQADWKAFFSVFSEENPFGDSMRGLSLVLPTEPTKPALVISGTYLEGDCFDKTRPRLSSDLIL